MELDLPLDPTAVEQWRRSPSVSPQRFSNAAEKARRAHVACRRCRRLRTKCKHENAVAPCSSCRKAGNAIAAECVFLPRGTKDEDREFRRPRGIRSKRIQVGRQNTPTTSSGTTYHENTSSPNIPGSTRSPSAPSPRSMLPPYEEVIQGCKVFSSSYFQLGFIPKAIFLERIAKTPESISPFLLLSILSVSARFTPCLVKRYGGGAKATEYFMATAASLVPDEMYRPTLDRTQALFLLGIAEWGNGDRDRSAMHMGMAVTMASILCLHREETYQLPQDASSDEIVDSEMARRTFWMIESQNNLHSGYSTPYSFALTDITTQLPCDEADFAFGVVPQERAVLAGTQAAAAHPDLISTPNRSLFASLIQAHNLWGQVARRACRSERQLIGATAKPWDEMSEYSQLSSALFQWEQDLPPRHRWSIRNLRGYKAESLDLAYLAIVMVLRLSNIVVRRIYLQECVRVYAHLFLQWLTLRSILGVIKSPPEVDEAPPNFWENMSNELFEDVLGLHEQIDAYLPLRTEEEGFPAIIVFCVYICGSLASYLWKTPQLCPRLAPKAEGMFHSSLQALIQLQYAWPMALNWQQALRKAGLPTLESNPSKSPKLPPLSPTAAKSQMPLAVDLPSPQSQVSQPHDDQQEPRLSLNATPRISMDMSSLETSTASYLTAPHISNHYQGSPNELSTFMDLENGMMIDNFEAELTAFLQGEMQQDVWSNWERQ